MNKIKNLIRKLQSFDRYNIIFVILVIFLGALLLRLSYLTIIRGDYYRDLSRNNRLRQIVIKSPRGNIYDRNGKLLAGTKSEFVVALRQEILVRNDETENNKHFLQLSRILEKDGSFKTDDFPFDRNTFAYADENTYLQEELSPEDYVLQMLLEHNMFKDIVNEKVMTSTENGNYEFNVLNRSISALKDKGLELKIISDKGIRFDAQDQATVNTLREFNLSPRDAVPVAIEKMVSQDETVLRKIMNHPAGRQLIYQKLKSRNLEGKVILNEITLKDYDSYINKKAALHKIYPKITLESKAIDDFVQIVDKSTLKELLQTVDFDSSNREIIPAKLAIDLLERKGITTNMTYEVFNSESNSSVMIKYTENYGEETPAIDRLIELLHEHKIVKTLVTDSNIKYVAQNLNTKNNINPSISINEWEYTYIKNIHDYYDYFDVEQNRSVKDLYNTVKEAYGCESFSEMDCYNILAIHNMLRNRIGIAYEPILLTYHLSATAVSQIEETFTGNDGIEITSEPIRYYPNGELASHLLGYIGKISTDVEFKEYIEGKNYNRNSLIGKTGIEQSQESSLRGEDGYLRILVDNKGNRTDTLNETKSKPGADVFLSIDADLQKVAEDALRKTLYGVQSGTPYESDWGKVSLGQYSEAKSGAVVVMDVETGEILAMASAPSYNPNLFATGISNSDWKSLQAENTKDPIAPRPLLNMAVQSALQPGSIYKLATSLAALETGWDPDTIINCGGFVKLGGKTFGCYNWNKHRKTDGPESIMTAIQDSCNYFFFSLALGKDQRGGYDLDYQLDIHELLKYSKKLGLGEASGIDISVPQESTGTLPDPEIKLKNFNTLYRKFLDENAALYLKDGVSNEGLDKKIDQLFDLTNRQEVPGRQEIIELLDKLGFEAEKPIRNERQGFADKIKFDYLNQAGWKMADSLNVVMGQGQNAYTPLQMVRYMAIFANDGYKKELSVVNKVKNPENNSILYEASPVSERIQLKDYKNLEIIRHGTYLAAKEGAEKRTFRALPIDVGLKTGTAEIGKNILTGEDYDSNAWMIAFAPYDKPKIAVCSVIVQGGSSHNNAPMMRDIIAKALGITPSKEQREALEELEKEEALEQEMEDHEDHEGHNHEDH